MTYILGIDPGITGAYTIISSNKKTIKVCSLFTNFETALADIEPYLGNLEACIEKVHAMPNQGSVSTATFMKNAGGWEGFLTALRIPYFLVTPQAWQKTILDTQAPKKPGSDKKTLNANRKLRKMHITAFILRYMPKAKKYFNFKYDQDKADAICIALYKRKQMGYKD